MCVSIDSLQCLIEGLHVTHVSMPLCPLSKSSPQIILHGPKLSQECTASSSVCSRGSFIIRFLQSDDCGRSVSFREALEFPYLLRQTNLGVSWSTGRQLQPCFPVVWSSTASTVHTMKSFLQHDLNIVFHPSVMKFVYLPFRRLGTFFLGRGLEGKGDFVAYQPMINVATCTGHHSGM